MRTHLALSGNHLQLNLVVQWQHHLLAVTQIVEHICKVSTVSIDKVSAVIVSHGRRLNVGGPFDWLHHILLLRLYAGIKHNVH
jgi:hypothetical protein